MKRALEARPEEALVSKLQDLSQLLLQQKIEGGDVDEGACVSALASFMELKELQQRDSGDRDHALDESLAQVESHEYAVQDLLAQLTQLKLSLEHMIKQRKEVVGDKKKVDDEEEDEDDDDLHELCRVLEGVRGVDKTLSSLKTQKGSVTLQRRELTSHLANMTTCGPSLAREANTFLPHIQRKEEKEGEEKKEDDDDEEKEEDWEIQRLPAPLYVLMTSLRVQCASRLRVWISKSTLSGEPIINIGHIHAPHDTQPLLEIAYSSDLHLVVARGHPELLKKLKKKKNQKKTDHHDDDDDDDDDDGVHSPSLTTLYRFGPDQEAARLSADPLWRPYRWCQHLCGLNAARTIEDYKRHKMTLEEFQQIVNEQNP